MIIKPFIKNCMLGEGMISRCCFSPWDHQSCGEVALGRTTLLIEGIRQKSSGQSRTLVLPETAPLVALLLLGSVRGQMLVSLELWTGASLPLLLALE